ncbi:MULTISPECIES: hypothetical protein [Acinetobacter]|uniref:hypothetical protein n=1 Tax=Acinetobacter TaxID=469 RepID=UPI001359EC1C|nr:MULTISPECIES: hypothetical protein [unclassified Acinetobacter]
MKVKCLGFEISTEKNLININDFIESNLVFEIKDIFKRDVFIDCNDPNYYKGLILTIKDQKASTAKMIFNSEGSFRVA